MLLPITTQLWILGFRAKPLTLISDLFVFVLTYLHKLYIGNRYTHVTYLHINQQWRHECHTLGHNSESERSTIEKVGIVLEIFRINLTISKDIGRLCTSKDVARALSISWCKGRAEGLSHPVLCSQVLKTYCSIYKELPRKSFSFPPNYFQTMDENGKKRETEKVKESLSSLFWNCSSSCSDIGISFRTY